MFLTPLQEALRAQPENQTHPVRESGYRGATVQAQFSGPDLEFGALVNGCGVYDLGFRVWISLTGGDRVRWLNGMVTNNVRDLPAGHGVYAFLLNPQGRILGDITVYHRDDMLVVETDRSQAEKIIATFDHYIIMDDVEVANISERQTTLGLAGPGSREILNAAGIEVPELQPLQVLTPKCTCDCGCAECTVVRGEGGKESYEIWLAPQDVYKTWRALVIAGATPVGSDALEVLRIANGIPLYGVDIRERDLPQETEQVRALNFSKGCYVGQEIVERIRSRGGVHRTFTGFLMGENALIAAGAKISVGEKEVGEITSVAVLPTTSGKQILALGYVRREAGVPGGEVTIGTGGAHAHAIVIQLPMQSLAIDQAEASVLHPG